MYCTERGSTTLDLNKLHDYGAKEVCLHTPGYFFSFFLKKEEAEVMEFEDLRVFLKHFRKGTIHQ